MRIVRITNTRRSEKETELRTKSEILRFGEKLHMDGLKITSIALLGLTKSLRINFMNRSFLSINTCTLKL